MASASWPRSLCVTLGLLAASSEAFFQEEGGGGPAGACKFILHELVKVSERTCFDELPKFLCCHQPPSIGCFKDQAHRDLCCEGPFSQKVLAQDYLIGLVMQKQDVLQRNCPFAAALTQLMPYQIEDLRLNKKTLFDHELTWLARAMSFAGAGWSNLLQNKWPVFGILRRIRDHLLRTEPKTEIFDVYYQQLETAPSEASQVGKALSRLNVTEDCMAGVTARLHLALLSEMGGEFPSSPSAQLVEEAEHLAVRCHRKLLPRLRGLLMSPAPVLTLLHEIWRKLRPKGWEHLAQQAKVRQPTSLTVNACLCELEWEMGLGDATSFRCEGNLGCCDPYGNGDFFCKTQPGCYQAYDSCFPRKSKIGGPGLDFLMDAQKDFLNHKLQGGSNDDLMKCRQIARAIEGMSLETKVLDVGAGTAPCKPIIRSLGYGYTAQDAKEYVGTEAIAGSVFLHGYADIDIVSDIADMPLPNKSFNVIVCTDVLEHVLRPREAIHEMGRLLKTGGMAFIQVPFGGALHNLPHHYYAGFTHFWQLGTGIEISKAL